MRKSWSKPILKILVRKESEETMAVSVLYNCSGQQVSTPGGPGNSGNCGPNPGGPQWCKDEGNS